MLVHLFLLIVGYSPLTVGAVILRKATPQPWITLSNQTMATNETMATNSDQRALTVATRAVALAFDRAMPLVQQAFFYLPFEHEEQLLSQIVCVSLFEGLAGRCEAGSQEKQFAEKCGDYAVRHRNVIEMFGRFPIRNKVLHRVSTPEELDFLKAHPLGF